jgi:mono/diheme cytochrome c family protein
MGVKTLALAAALGSAMISTAALAEAGPFTQQQADDGKTKYNNHCATCHRPNLQGGQGPALTGDAFKGKWGGKPVTELRDYIHKTMPPTAPNSLPDDQLDPIMAFILSKNGAQPGDKPLSKESASAQFPK